MKLFFQLQYNISLSTLLIIIASPTIIEGGPPLTHQKKIQCDQCEYTCKYQSHLDQHKRIHSKEKPYQCEICGKCFSQSGNRNVHLRLKHALDLRNIQQFQCRLCHKRYTTKSDRNRHEEEHAIERHPLEALSLLALEESLKKQQ